MKAKLAMLLLLSGLAACSDTKVTRQVTVDETRQVPRREVVVEERRSPAIEGVQTEERIIQERVVPRAQMRRTETTVTTED